jgi:hypothetical protein
MTSTDPIYETLTDDSNSVIDAWTTVGRERRKKRPRVIFLEGQPGVGVTTLFSLLQTAYADNPQIVFIPALNGDPPLDFIRTITAHKERHDLFSSVDFGWRDETLHPYYSDPRVFMPYAIQELLRAFRIRESQCTNTGKVYICDGSPFNTMDGLFWASKKKSLMAPEMMFKEKSQWIKFLNWLCSMKNVTRFRILPEASWDYEKRIQNLELNGRLLGLTEEYLEIYDMLESRPNSKFGSLQTTTEDFRLTFPNSGYFGAADLLPRQCAFNIAPFVKRINDIAK